jgi:hypothetical protein
MPTTNYNQFSNTRPFLGAAPAHLSGEDAERIPGYQLYEEIYWNVPETFKVVQRGTDSQPIYIPSARMVIEAINRYYAAEFNYDVRGGTPADREVIGSTMRALFRRERFFSKFNSFKRFALVRGDALWHITADPGKPAGRRISIHELDPARYFPIYDPDDVDRITGCHLVQLVKDAKGNVVAQRQTYRKDPETGRIINSIGLYEATAWDDRNLAQDPKPPEVKLLEELARELELPPEVTALPVYHVKNQWQAGNLFGSSDMRGFEGIIAGINQGISDEDLTLALDGLGVYWTTAKRPAGGWVLGPGSVIEGEREDEFQRVSGTSSVEPMQSHLNFLLDVMKRASGTPDIATGNVDVSVAESGIALALQMGPLLAKARERETELLAVHDNMFFDLTRMWLSAYEGIGNGLAVDVTPTVGTAMPIDRKATLEEIVLMLGNQLISPEYARMLLTRDLGYEFPETMGADILSSLKALSEATNFDPFEERVRRELSTDAATSGANGSGT